MLTQKSGLLVKFSLLPAFHSAPGKAIPMFQFTPLLGAQSNSAACQSLLEFDGGVKILIDVGWDETFDVEYLKLLERHVPTLSIILLTHPTPPHIAAFAHCCKHFPLFTRIPIYATTPVISLGRTLLQDLYASTPLASTIIPASALAESSYSFPSSISRGEKSNILLQPPSPKEIAGYFSLIQPLKYFQPHQPLPSPFSPPLNGLTITAYNAGHTLGGTIWHIQHGLESVVYAVDWNQARENVLAGADWLERAGAGGTDIMEQLKKPTALICSSRGAERLAPKGGRKKRDDLLLDLIRTTLQRGGTVLVPTDSSARVLELAYLLERSWRAEPSAGDSLRASKVYLASRNIGATMRYARSMPEWMDESIIRELEAVGTATTPQRPERRQNHQRTDSGTQNDERQAQGKTAGPFDFKHIRLIQRRTQIERLLNIASNNDVLSGSGLVFLASDSSLVWGFSKEIFRKIAGDPKNLIILTERRENNRSDPLLSETLWDWLEIGEDGAMAAGENGEISAKIIYDRDIDIKEPQRVPLDGNELSIYQQYLATQRQLQTTLQSNREILVPADNVEDNSSDSSSSEESDSERQGKALNISAALAHSNRSKIGLSVEDLGINVLLRRKGVYDYDVRGKKGREKMFPFVMKRRRADEFGDLIRPEDYLRAEERDEDRPGFRSSGQFRGNTGNTLGEKRRWGDVGLQDGNGGRRPSANGTNRRYQGGWQNRAKAGDGSDASRENSPLRDLGADDDSENSDYEENASDIGPSKLVVSSEKIKVQLRLAFVDFAGLHDKQSLQILIPLIQPRKLILVGGTKDETTSLAADCRKLLSARAAGLEAAVDVFTPIVGKTVDASVDTNSWTVKLSESLVKRLHWQSVRGLGVVHLTGRLAASSIDDNDDAEARENRNKKQKLNDSNRPTQEESLQPTKSTMESIPVLDVLPTSMASATRSVAHPLHVGDLRLADLRKILQSSGHTAEFRGQGTLFIDSLVVVRKTGTGMIEVEGGGLAVSEGLGQNQGTFYAVRKKIYEGLALVAGG
ncbi:MAG: hypothetical protein M1829_006826 [Trizodia sp. TS-e1964]|nr:MAG: hypothetical protein M1829_006826 [Trizodia sp. TS-e1964]